MNPWEEDYGDVATATEAPPWEAEFQRQDDNGDAQQRVPTGDQLNQYEPPNAASRALEAARQYLSPILGRTAQQQMAEGPRDTEGLLPAASKPIIPLPKFTHAAGDSKPMAVGKAIGNTALGFAEFFESPLGLATMGTAAIPNAGRIVAGAFAADLGSKLPEAITTTKQTVANPNASFGEKAEAVIGTTTQAGLVGLTGRAAMKGRAVNTEAAALEREVTAGQRASDGALAEVSASKAPEVAQGGKPLDGDALQRVPTTMAREPAPWEMEYAGGEMPRTPATFGDLPSPRESTTKNVVDATPPTGLAQRYQSPDWSALDAVTDPFHKYSWLEKIANAGRKVNDTALGGVLDRLEKIEPEVGSNAWNVAWAVAQNPSALPATKARALALREHWMRIGREESPPSTLDPRPSTVAEPQPWEMEYAGGEMPRETSKFTEVPEGRATLPAGKVGSKSANVGSASAKVETPVQAVAKVQQHVAEVKAGKPVQVEGRGSKVESGMRPAKEIKSELVQRLEQAIEKAKSETDLSPAQQEALALAKSNSFSELPDRPNSNKIDRLAWERERADKLAVIKATRNSQAKATGLEQVTIQIPGDGEFTIWNTKEALEQVLERAKKISTANQAPSGSAFTKTKATGNLPPDVWVNSSEPTHLVTVKGLEGSKEILFNRLGRPIEIPSLPGEKLFLTSDGTEFRITEPQTGLSVGTGNTIANALKDAAEKVVRIKEKGSSFKAARDKNLKQGSRLPEPQTVQQTPTHSTLEGWADKVLSQDPRKRTRMGLDPAEEARRLAAVAIKGSYLIARGVRDFAQWVKEITAQIPELAAKSEAELRRIYAQAVDIAEGRDPLIGDSVRGMKIKADTSLSDQVRENVEAAYTKRVSANDIAEAQRLIREAGGPERAANDILTGLWKPVDPTVQVKGAGEVLAGLAQLEKAAGGNSARANELADLQVRVAEFSTRNATTPAQWLQAYNSLYANYSPAAWLKEWRAAVAKARRERVERATGQPVGESPTEIAQGIADGVAEGVRPDAPTTAEVIKSVFGSKKPGTAGGGQKPETTTEAVERIIGHKGEQAQRTAKKIQDFYEREVNKFKRKHKIPELSPEDQRSILAEAKAIERLPAESLQRREAVLRLLDQLHRRKGFEWWELPLSFWYAHTLSGPTTHAKNILGNGVNLGMEAGMQALLKPTNIPIILESLGRSLSVGAKEAASILRTGHDTSARHGDKFELRRNVMELQNGTLDKVLLPWKLVGRFLRAEDAVFFNAGQELRAAILSKRANGESTAAARKAMGWTPEARTAAEAQAASEGMTGLNYQRRVNEIIEQGRAEDVMNAARDFGYDVTFNNEPYGVLGAFTSAINRGFEAAPVFKPFILPFTRIVANVSNSSLNWTPVGNYRALRAQRKLAWLGRAENNGKLYGRAINDPLAIRDAHARALLGTAAIVGITAAAVKNVFDDNPQFMVTGSGPTNLDQRNAWRAAGNIPYSVKVGNKFISYADKPPQLALAMVGHYLDAIRYKNLDREDALNRVTYALNGSFGVLLQSSWLQGLSSLFNQANRESTKNFTQGMTAQAIKTGSGVFVPAALRQLDQFFDPKRYSPDDVQGMLLAQVPWARRNGHPDLNAFGQPVSSPASKIFWSQVEGDALVRRLAGQRVFPGVPAEGDLTPEEHYALVKYRGPILREMLATQADEWAGAPRLIAQDIVNRISSAATAQAKADLGLDEANNERRMQRKLTTK